MYTNIYYDVIISGGGINGILTAIALSKNSISVAVIDQNDQILSAAENRVFALSKKSQEILNQLGIWQHIEKNSEPILDILIRDQKSPIVLNYNHKLVSHNPMGYVINSNNLCDILKIFVKNFTVYSNTTYHSVETTQGMVEITLKNEKKITSSLLICAEGKNSKLRQMLAIPCIFRQYSQNSITCNITHNKNHNNIAIEHFFPGGPFAILPMKGGYKSSIVWTEKTHIAEMLMSLSENDFVIELQKKCLEYLGDIKIDSQRYCFPLSLSFAKRLYSQRAVLIGDAAHSIHPVAGQGLNLGLKDIDSIVKNVLFAKSRGIDIGSYYILQKFSQERYFDNFSMATATNVINGIFSNKSLFCQLTRNIGLSIVENFSPIKKFFIKHAMGLH